MFNGGQWTLLQTVKSVVLAHTTLDRKQMLHHKKLYELICMPNFNYQWFPIQINMCSEWFYGRARPETVRINFISGLIPTVEMSKFISTHWINVMTTNGIALISKQQLFVVSCTKVVTGCAVHNIHVTAHNLGFLAFMYYKILICCLQSLILHW